jgi:hypothetical protein
VWAPSDITALALAAGGRMLQWDEFLDVLEASEIDEDDLVAQIRRAKNEAKTWQPVGFARSGVFCSTGVPCQHQSSQTWKPDGKKVR